MATIEAQRQQKNGKADAELVLPPQGPSAGALGAGGSGSGAGQQHAPSSANGIPRLETVEN